MPRKNSTMMIAGTRMIAKRAVRSIERMMPKITAPTAATAAIWSVASTPRQMKR